MRVWCEQRGIRRSGGWATEFADDLRRALHASQPDGLFRQTIIFACDLARRPA
jgi:hypothetical protein